MTESAAAVTTWIGQLKRGDAAAAQAIWSSYFQRMVALAKSRLRGVRKGVADEEDVALSAFKSLCQGAEQGRFPELADRDSLWPLLVVLTVRKACDLANRERAAKRGGRLPLAGPLGEWGLSQEQMPWLEEALSREPSPQLAAQLEDEMERRLGGLDELPRRIVLMKLEGHTNAQIAKLLGCGKRSVDRKLALVRQRWIERE